MTTSSVKRQRSAAGADEETPGEITGANGATFVKSDSEEEAWSSSGYNYINPFVHHVRIDNRIDIAKIYVLTVLLLPIRVVGCVLSLVTAWMFACIGLYGIRPEDLKEKPISGWRKQVKHIARGCMRMLYASGSFQYITFKGVQASSKEAPIMVVAPHSSYADSIIVAAAGPPSLVAKQETSSIPLLGKIIMFAQPIFVQREDPNSRQNTIREIVERSRSEEEWPAVVIFAEGTCTNRSALIQFKPGAFYPGVPVQPVLLRYPNKIDSFTWTWDGPSVWRLIWLTMAQFHSRCVIEFLPVYTPSEEEKKDAKLYANNVRDVMAKALGVPTSEYSFEDVIMMSRARDMKIPFPGDIVEIERTLYNLGLLEYDRDGELATEFLSMSNTDKIDAITFSELLQIELKNPQLHQLFTLLDHSRRGTVNLKSLLLCSLFCKLKNEEIVKFLRSIVPLYAESERSITRESFAKILRHSGKITQKESDALFFAIDDTNKGHITFDNFESYTKDHAQYRILHKRPEHIRRNFKTAQ